MSKTLSAARTRPSKPEEPRERSQIGCTFHGLGATLALAAWRQAQEQDAIGFGRLGRLASKDLRKRADLEDFATGRQIKTRTAWEAKP